MSGVLSASATCFFAYVGFDAIAASGEEARNPQRFVYILYPISLSPSLSMYLSISLSLGIQTEYQSCNVRFR